MLAPEDAGAVRLTEGELDELYRPHGGVAAYARRLHALLSTAFLPAQPPRGAVRFLCARQQPRILRRRAAREKARLTPRLCLRVSLTPRQAAHVPAAKKRLPHQSRQRHALSRQRAEGGAFLRAAVPAAAAPVEEPLLALQETEEPAAGLHPAFCWQPQHARCPEGPEGHCNQQVAGPTQAARSGPAQER